MFDFFKMFMKDKAVTDAQTKIKVGEAGWISSSFSEISYYKIYLFKGEYYRFANMKYLREWATDNGYLVED